MSRATDRRYATGHQCRRSCDSRSRPGDECRLACGNGGSTCGSCRDPLRTVLPDQLEEVIVSGHAGIV